jgi:hypothetical protein
MEEIKIGRLLRSTNTEFVVGCRVNQLGPPSFGSMVRIKTNAKIDIYGLIYNITVSDDGLVRQLSIAPDIAETVIADTQENRNVPVEISVLAIGYLKDGRITHLPPPTPPLSLDNIFLCNHQEITNFTQANKFGYLRQILKHQEAPAAELLASHFIQANEAHLELGSSDWLLSSSRELTILLRDDFAMLTDVFGALAAAIPEINPEVVE